MIMPKPGPRSDGPDDSGYELSFDPDAPPASPPQSPEAPVKMPLMRRYARKRDALRWGLTLHFWGVVAIIAWPLSLLAPPLPGYVLAASMALRLIGTGLCGYGAQGRDRWAVYASGACLLAAVISVTVDVFILAGATLTVLSAALEVAGFLALFFFVVAVARGTHDEDLQRQTRSVLKLAAGAGVLLVLLVIVWPVDFVGDWLIGAALLAVALILLMRYGQALGDLSLALRE